MSKIAILVSGAGTTLNEIAVRSHWYSNAASIIIPDTEISCVISNNPYAKAADVCKKWQLPYFVISNNVNNWDRHLYSLLDHYMPDLVVMAGFLRKIDIRHDWKERILNIHPSLLPKFGGHRMFGMRCHEAVIAAGEKESGCSVHICTNEIDEGRILAQSKIEIAQNETPHSLCEKVKGLEKKLYPKVIADYLTFLKDTV